MKKNAVEATSAIEINQNEMPTKSSLARLSPAANATVGVMANEAVISAVFMALPVKSFILYLR